ncbi:MAG: hypothetical protein K2M11_00875 [Paramuribaculum sp.]|nr:hypothetical protein [Paramuribaculum sp.]
MTDKNIETLLDRFFEGETTCAEEAQLQQFFAGNNVPPHLREYIPMFKWYADGMPGEPGSELESPAGKNRRRFIKPLIWISSAAAAIAVVFSLGWNYHTRNIQRELLAKQHEGSYIMIDGNMTTDIEYISDDIKAINLEAESIELELRAAELSAIADNEEFFS